MTLSINSPAFNGTIRIADGNLDRPISDKKDFMPTTAKEDVLEIKKVTKMLSDPKKVGYISSIKGRTCVQFKVIDENGTPQILDINTAKSGGFNFAIYNKDSKGYELTIYQKELEESAKTYHAPLKNFFATLNKAIMESPKVTTPFGEILTEPAVTVTTTEFPKKLEKWAQKLKAMSSCDNPEKLQKITLELKKWGWNSLTLLKNMVLSPKKSDTTQQITNKNTETKPVLEYLKDVIDPPEKVVVELLEETMKNTAVLQKKETETILQSRIQSLNKKDLAILKNAVEASNESILKVLDMPLTPPNNAKVMVTKKLIAEALE